MPIFLAMTVYIYIYIYKYICSSGFWHGRTGQPPGAAFFHDTWGAARAVKKKKNNPLRRHREAVFYYLSFHCVGANWRRCLLRRCRAQKLCEKGKGARRGGQFTSGSLPNGTDKGGGIHCMQWFSTRGPSRIQMRPNMLNHGRRQGGNSRAVPPPNELLCPPLSILSPPC